MSQTVAAVVLAAGQGTRMRSRRAKVLHDVAGLPMISHVLAELRGAGIERVVVVIGWAAEQVEERLAGQVEFVRQVPPRGTADAVRCAASLLEGAADLIIVAYGDCPLVQRDTFSRLIQAQRQTDAALAFTTGPAADPTGYGRIVREPGGRVTAIVEEADASPEIKSIVEVNLGFYCFRAQWLWSHVSQVAPSTKGEFYLTDLVALAADERATMVTIEDSFENLAGVNDRLQLAAAERVLRERIRVDLMRRGVTLIDPATTYIDRGVEIGMDTIVYPNTFIRGRTTIGTDCAIGPNSQIIDSTIGDSVIIWSSVVEGAQVAEKAQIGPMSHLRPGADIGPAARLGNYAEVKNAQIGARTQMHHFSYVGDALLGSDVNVGAGTITCNYNSETGLKSQTVVGPEASLGSDTLLVAPVAVGAGAMTGAGSILTRNVPDGMLAVGSPARPIRPVRRTRPLGQPQKDGRS